MGSATREFEMESRIRQLESDLRSAKNLKLQMVEAVEYMAHRSEEVEEGVLNRSTSRGGSYWPGSTSEEHLVLKIDFLEEQIEKLEQKLEKNSENLTLEKEKNRMLQADLSRQEQEMRDSRIELRIARRESKTALDKLVKLEESVKLPDSSQIKAKDDEIEYLRLEIKKLKTDLEEAKNSLSEKNRQVEEHEKDLDIANKAASTAREHQREAQRIKTDLAVCQRLKRTIELELKNAEENISRHNEEKSRLLRSLEQEKAKLVEKEAIISTLKQTMDVMDEKLKNFEVAGNDVEKKELELELEKSRLEGEVERLTKEFSAAKQQVNENKSFKLMAESRLKKMEELVKNHKADFMDEISSLKEAVIRAESEAEKVKTANANMEKLLVDAECTFDNQLITLKNKNDQLQKELTALITERNSLENMNSLLGEKLSEAIGKSESYEERILRLDFALDAANRIHMEREHQFEKTLLQHAKATEFLQAMAEQPGKKNKSLTDKLLGSGGNGTLKRESRYSDVVAQNSAYRDLEERLEKKDGQIRSLTQQLKHCKDELAEKSENKSCSVSSSLAADVTTFSIKL